MSERPLAPFKIAMREEGEWITVYFAALRMYGNADVPPLEMGRIRKTVLVAAQGRDAFLEIMRNGVQAMSPMELDRAGWDTLRAPEDERTGKA